MYDVFKGTKALLKRDKKITKPRADNLCFRLHYQYTYGFLAISVLLVTGYSYIDSSGSAIQCMVDAGIKVSGDIINSYCWIMSTYSLPKHYEGVRGADFVHHGVGPEEEGDDTVYHAYYQWVPLFLSFQAVMFYVPHYIWKILEGGRFRMIVAGLTSSMYDGFQLDLDNVTNYMIRRMRPGMRGEHKSWALKLYFCEFLNFINVIIQLVLTDKFLGGSFSNYGLQAAQWSDMEAEDRVDPMYKVFPRMTKCKFHKYGSSGTIEKVDAMCVLGMNIINEKIFVFLWFWYVFLAIMNSLNLLVRMGEICVPSMRRRLIQLEEFGTRNKRINPDLLAGVLDHLGYSDWQLLYYLAQCMDIKAFSMLLSRMGAALDAPENDDLKEGLEDDEDIGRNSTLKSPYSLKNFIPMNVVNKRRTDV